MSATPKTTAYVLEQMDAIVVAADIAKKIQRTVPSLRGTPIAAWQEKYADQPERLEQLADWVNNIPLYHDDSLTVGRLYSHARRDSNRHIRQPDSVLSTLNPWVLGVEYARRLRRIARYKQRRVSDWRNMVLDFHDASLNIREDDAWI